MYFIEQLFGVSPDGGSGSVEFLLFAIPALGVGLLTLWRRRNYGMRR
jgi:MYXO-CTERM domain-containing protein